MKILKRGKYRRVFVGYKAKCPLCNSKLLLQENEIDCNLKVLEHFGVVGIKCPICNKLVSTDFYSLRQIYEKQRCENERCN